ncbi:MAG: amidohydrolase family protein [Dermatophilaceae bacterium]
MPRAAASSFRLADVSLHVPGSPPRTGVDVVVEAGEIRSVTAAQPGAQTAFPELSGSVVLPGLVDMHVHFPPHPGLARLVSLLLIAHGVTAVRDAGDVDGTAGRAVADARAAGHPVPRVEAAGRFVTAPPARWPNSHVVSTPYEAAAAVADLAASGSRWVKSYENLDIAMVRAIVREAGQLGLGVMGHVPAQLSYEEASLPDAQHFFGVPAPGELSGGSVLERSATWAGVGASRIRAVVDHAVSNGLANTPTLVQSARLVAGHGDPDGARRDPTVQLLPPAFAHVVWDPCKGLPVYRNLAPERLRSLHDAQRRKQALLLALHDAGARLHLGTDTSQPWVVGGAALLEEMALWHRAGIGTQEVWRLASSGAGAAMRTPGLGQLEPGSPADLLVVDEDPTSDPTILEPSALRRRIRAVVTAGAIWRGGALDAAVREHQAWHRRIAVDRLTRLMATRTMRRAARDFVDEETAR